ncbi:MAG: hypothetical protein IJU51_06430 [Clostridia bacterium]|nr:hypothetical protein [Clostridia bacterium]
MRLPLGRFTLVVSYPLVCIMTAVMILDRSCLVVLCFLAALMHETGHLAALAHFHAAPDTIKLTLFDVAIIDNKKALRKASQELVVILAGVSVNFISAAIAYSVYSCLGGQELLVFSQAHLTLGLFNSLPVYSLDGGQALSLLLEKRFSPGKADRIIMAVSLVFLFPMALWGFLILFQTRYNFTLLLASVWLIAETLRR